MAQKIFTIEFTDMQGEKQVLSLHAESKDEIMQELRTHINIDWGKDVTFEEVSAYDDTIGRAPQV